VDLSALIFVALAVAWAVYLIPKALKHHEDAQQRRTVDDVSQSMRVLARREPVDSRQATLVVPGRATAQSAAAPAEAVEVRPAVARAAAARAAKRRLRVVLLILAANVAVAAAAVLGNVPWAYQAIPAGVLVAWLVACRLMVKKERAAAPARRTEVAAEAVVDAGPETEEIAVVPAAERDPDSWDPVPVTLPTYVDKEAASRSVRTIDLDSTGVWSSGRSESDSALAREADEAARAAKNADADERRAAGS
jgi:hypothetical protein